MTCAQKHETSVKKTQGSSRIAERPTSTSRSQIPCDDVAECQEPTVRPQPSSR